MDKPSKGNILLLDDDKFLVDMYSMKFTGAGYAVQACLSASEALDALRGGFTPDAIVFDIVMPEQDGFSFLQAVTDEKLAAGATKIALTNQSNDADCEKITALGASRCIIKASMIPSEVVNTVGEEIAKKKKS